MVEMTIEQLKARILQLESEKLSKRANTLSFKVTDKGGVSVYGLGRFPVSLYKSQWDALLAVVDPLKAFIAENESKLATKGDGAEKQTISPKDVGKLEGVLGGAKA